VLLGPEHSDTGSGCAARVGTVPVANAEYAALRRKVPVDLRSVAELSCATDG
jgi:hypothetical protein